MGRADAALRIDEDVIDCMAGVLEAGVSEEAKQAGAAQIRSILLKHGVRVLDPSAREQDNRVAADASGKYAAAISPDHLVRLDTDHRSWDEELPVRNLE